MSTETMTKPQTSNDDLIVDIVGLKKHYGETEAVRGIDLKIPRGSIFGFLGPNGAGKTTTIGCLLTLLKPTAGQGTIAGYDMWDTKNIRQVVSAVFQEQTLDETLSGEKNLTLHADLYRIPKDIRDERISSLVDMVGLKDRLKDKVLNYSGGMRRRLEIVRALLTEPEILFLDEPTIGLDPQSRQNIWDRLIELNKEKGITIFITTHLMEEAEYLCEKINIIDLGKIITEGTADELKDSLGKDLITLEVKKEDMEEANSRVSKLEKVMESKIVGDEIQITTKNGGHMISQVVESMIGNGKRIEITSLALKKPTLNDVFLFYTGSNLRDDSADLADRLKIVGRKQFRGRGMMRR